jgi:hypothetical protein
VRLGAREAVELQRSLTRTTWRPPPGPPRISSGLPLHSGDATTLGRVPARLHRRARRPDLRRSVRARDDGCGVPRRRARRGPGRRRRGDARAVDVVRRRPGRPRVGRARGA